MFAATFSSKSLVNNSELLPKMSQTELAGEYRDRSVAGGRTVVVGVKLDSQSRELLTWALVKQAQPGDRVVALHVLTNNGRITDFKFVVILSIS